MGLDVVSGSAGQAALKIRYAKYLRDIVEEQIKKSNATPFWMMLSQKKGNTVESAFGQSFVIPVRSQIQAGVSADPTVSYNKITGTGTGSSSIYNAFTIPVTTKYNHAQVSGLSLTNSVTDAQAFVKLGQKEIDSAIQGTIRTLATLAAGSGYGDRAQVASVSNSPNKVVLLNKYTATNFRVGTDIVAAASLSSGALRSTTPITVTSIDTSTGTLFLSADPTGQSWAANDFIFANGDRPNTPALVNHFGLSFWIPATLPTVGSGNDATGVERSTVELAGHRFDGGGGALVDVLQDASAFAVQNSLPIDMIVMNPLDVAKVSKAQEAKRHVEMKAKAVEVGFETLSVQSALGADMPLLSDRTIPQGRFYMVDSTSFSLLYSGPDIVHVVGAGPQEDGLIYRQVQGSDKWIAMIRSYSNIGCEFPGNNMTVSNYV